MNSEQEKWKLLKEVKYATIYYSNNTSAQFHYNNFSAYFSFGETYKRIELIKENEILHYLEKIIRIECKFDGIYYPIWTSTDGIIIDHEHFIRLRGKYYSIKSIESILDTIDELKQVINNASTF